MRRFDSKGVLAFHLLPGLLGTLVRFAHISLSRDRFMPDILFSPRQLYYFPALISLLLSRPSHTNHVLPLPSIEQVTIMGCILSIDSATVPISQPVSELLQVTAQLFVRSNPSRPCSLPIRTPPHYNAPGISSRRPEVGVYPHPAAAAHGRYSRRLRRHVSPLALLQFPCAA
jgi:hypothetical protein